MGMLVLRSPERMSGAQPALEPSGIAGWLLELLRGLRGKGEVPRKEMQLLETLSLGGRRQLMLVACGGERFLVGCGPESVETIARVQAEILPEAAAKNLDETCL